MKNSLFAVMIMTLVISIVSSERCLAQRDNNSPSRCWIIHSKSVAERWEDALLTGNGKHGTMVWGRPGHERIICVHEELFLPNWPRDLDASVAISDMLPKVRDLVTQGKYGEAAGLACRTADQRRKELGIPGGMLWGPTPHPAFDLVIGQTPVGKVREYGRYLNLETGEAVVRWSDAAGMLEEKVFSSRTHNVNVVLIRAHHGKKLNMTLGLGETPGREGTYFGQNLPEALKIKQDVERDQLYFHAAYARGPGGYEGLARVSTCGGHVERKRDHLQIRDADQVLVVLRISPLKDAGKSVRDATWKDLNELPDNYEKLLKSHVVEHERLFHSVTLDLGCEKNWMQPTEDILNRANSDGASSLLLEQLHAMGRYLFISSCGRFPPPLQGIWGGGWMPAWAGGFVFDSNINLAISAGSMGNMHESMESYFSFIERQLPAWHENARKYLGCRGFLVGHYTDPEKGSLHHYASSYPWMFWPGGAGWNIRPFYDHYLLTGNRKFLANRVFPLYREMADFYEDYLVEGPDGQYVITPGISPENTPLNSNSLLTFNTTFDVAVAREVFHILIQTCQELGIEKENITKWDQMRSKLPPYLINQDGALKEWASPLFHDRYSHRHNSHLYPIYPGTEFLEVGASPELLKATRIALNKRFAHDTTSAHGLVHIGLMAARLHDVTKVKGNMDRFASRGYLYKALATSHNPNGDTFNMDGIMSFPTLIMEALVFSLPGQIELMPAWPVDAHPSGSINGILARGGFSVDLSWNNGEMVAAVIHSKHGGPCAVSYHSKQMILQTAANKRYCLDKNLRVVPVTHSEDEGIVSHHTR